MVVTHKINGKQALDYLGEITRHVRSDGSSFDKISDVEMPEMDGIHYFALQRKSADQANCLLCAHVPSECLIKQMVHKVGAEILCKFSRRTGRAGIELCGK